MVDPKGACQTQGCPMSPSGPPDPSARDEVMRRVRAALGRTGTESRSQAPSDHPVIDGALVRVASHGARTVDLFLERTLAVGMNPHRCSTATLATTLAGVLRAEGVRSLCVG